jgi:gamma-glutamylcyclotransferase (GGCT)/AIG2-like uncharacterized protein YtfP
MIQEYLFVYGTLMRSFENPYAQFLRRNNAYIGKGFFYGELYDLGSYPTANYLPHKTSKVIGEIYALNNPLETLKILDAYEGLGNSLEESTEYLRMEIPVQSDNKGAIWSCWVYLCNCDTTPLKVIHSGDYALFSKQFISEPLFI